MKILQREGKRENRRQGLIRSLTTKLRGQLKELVGTRSKGSKKTQIYSSIDSGIGLGSSSSSILASVDDPRSWTSSVSLSTSSRSSPSSPRSSTSPHSSPTSSTQLIPILRSPSAARSKAKKSISFSGPHRVKPPRPSGRQQKPFIKTTLLKSQLQLQRPVHQSSLPRARSLPQTIRVSQAPKVYGRWGDVGPQLENIYTVVFQKVQETIPTASSATLNLIFCPGQHLQAFVASLTDTHIGQVIGDLRTLLFPAWPQLGLHTPGQAVLLHLLHTCLGLLLQDSPQAAPLLHVTLWCRSSNYSPVCLCLDNTRHVFLAYWCGLLEDL